MKLAFCIFGIAYYNSIAFCKQSSKEKRSQGERERMTHTEKDKNEIAKQKADACLSGLRETIYL